jgi:hypothetical protein
MADFSGFLNAFLAGSFHFSSSFLGFFLCLFSCFFDLFLALSKVDMDIPLEGWFVLL